MTPQVLDMTTLRDLEAEQAVLGSIFLAPSTINDVMFLAPRDFASEQHRLIFQVMQHLASRDVPIDIVTITAEFQKHNRLNDMGSVSYLSRLSNSAPTAANIEYYASIVRSKAIRRRATEYGQKLIDMAGDDFETDEEFLSAVEDEVLELRPTTLNKMRSFRESREDYYKHLEEKAAKLKTGLFKQYDEWAQLWRGWLYILAGRPGVGKTAKALMLAYGIAKHNTNPGAVLIWSQEMDENEVKDRIVSMVAGVNYPRLINKGGDEGFNEAEWTRINNAYKEIEKLPIFIQDSAGVTIDEIRATVKQFRKRHGKVAAVIVDYLQIMDIPQRKNEMRAQAIGKVTKSAKHIARRNKLIFVLLSQLDRSVDNEEPKLKHLKESGSIEQDADVVEFLWHNHNDQPDRTKKIIDSIFAKGRNVGANRFKLEFHWWYQRFVEIVKKVN
ncbi:replicative DNA helicase [Paenibacillus sp. 481]|uniref:replicative DNA helicase n=1 Tax=Paenibacillus sp. 481 TaxID=2835869 RepID=UPI001E30DF87|nr:DnaB-like helicase C-terminal domain-containing protein [Paenibacillus sp. 481]